jgi:hypothetical protein
MYTRTKAAVTVQLVAITFDWGGSHVRQISTGNRRRPEASEVRHLEAMTTRPLTFPENGSSGEFWRTIRSADSMTATAFTRIGVVSVIFFLDLLFLLGRKLFEHRVKSLLLLLVHLPLKFLTLLRSEVL